jgi:hypothetical protein
MVDKSISASTTHISVPGKKSSSTKVVKLAMSEPQDDFIEDKLSRDSSANQSEDKAKPLDALEGTASKSKPSLDLESICRDLDIKEDVHGFFPFMSRSNKAYALMTNGRNLYALEVKSKAFRSVVRKSFKKKGDHLNRSRLTEIIEDIEAEAFDNGIMLPVYHRVGSTDGGFEYDLGDAGHTRIRVKNGVIEKITAGSQVIFVRNNVMLETPWSDDAGDRSLLRRFVNLNDEEWILYLGAIGYYIAHPKLPGAEYPILAFISGQGTGKSFLSYMTQCLVDNNTVGLQTLPRRIKDIVIAMNNTHLLCLDNLRYLSTQHTDLFCVSATSGTFIDRALYTDSDMHVSFVQCPVLFNGIHDFNDQPDLAERMLVLHPQMIEAKNRQSKARLQAEFEKVLPVIFKGLLEYIAKILKVLPDVTPTNPARMYDVSHWYAAMEQVDGVEEGSYQSLYKENQQQAQLDSLLESPLAAAVVEFSESLQEQWRDEPVQLLQELCELVPMAVRRTQDWPSNSIALTKRSKSLQAGLRSQGIYVEFGRGKKRWISITTAAIEARY